MSRYTSLEVQLRTHALLIYSLVVFAFFVIAYRYVFQLGILAYGDTQPWAVSWQASLGSFSNAWTQNGLGERSTFGPLSLFTALILGLFSNDYYLVQKLFLFSLLPLSYISSAILLRGLIKSNLVVSVASFAYSINPLTLSEFLGGAQGLLLTYAALPLLAHLTMELRKHPTFNNTLKLAILVILVSSFNFQAPAILLPALAPIVLASSLEQHSSHRRQFLKYLLCFLFIVSIPEVLSLILQQSVAQLSVATNVDVLADYRRLNLVGIFLFLGMTFALFASSAAFSCERKLAPLRTLLLGISVLIVLFVYLTSLGITAELFLRMPFLLVYRASVKLLYPLAFAFTVLTAIFLDSVMGLRVPFSKTWKAILIASRPALIISLLVLPVIVYHDSQVLTGNLGLSNSAQLGGVFGHVGNWLDTKRSGGYFRTLWLPQDIQTDYALRAFDPNTFILRSGSVPNQNHTSPTVEYVKGVLEDIVEASIPTIGTQLSNAAVKYIVLNLDSLQNDSPHLQSEWLTYYAKGSPISYQHILEAQVSFRLVESDSHFQIYENVDFRPHVVAYNRILALQEHEESFPYRVLANYTGNLVKNPDFSGNFSGWKIVRGQWTLSEELGHVATLGSSKDPWAVMVQEIPVEASSSFFFSAYMRLANAFQSHIKIEWYDASGHLLDGTFLQTGIDGSKDWFAVTNIAFSPPRTSMAKLYLEAGGASANLQAGLTWFAEPTLKKAFVRLQYRPDNFESFLWSTLNNQTLLVRSLQINQSLFNQLTSSVETVLVYAGSGEPERFQQESFEASLVRHTIVAAGGATNFTPINGTWSTLPSDVASYGYLVTSQNGAISTSFKTTVPGLYRLALRLTAGSSVMPEFSDDFLMPSESYFDDTGFQWIEYGGMNLLAGTHVLTIRLNGGLDLAYLLSVNNENETVRQSLVAPSLFFTIVESNTVKHALEIESNSGALVFLADNFDYGWEARTDRLRLEHFPGLNQYSWGNAFLLPSGGKQEVTLYFAEQDYRNNVIMSYLVFWALILAAPLIGFFVWCVENGRRIRRVIL